MFEDGSLFAVAPQQSLPAGRRRRLVFHGHRGLGQPATESGTNPPGVRKEDATDLAQFKTVSRTR